MRDRTTLRAAVIGALTLALAAAVLPPAAAVEGEDAAALLARGREELERDEVGEAIATLERAVELRPEDSQHHLWLGRAYLAKLQKANPFKKLGWSRKVHAEFQRAVELDPQSVEARTSLASFYFQAPAIAGGSFDKGREQVAEIRRRDLKAAHLLMASTYAEREEPAEAKREYRAAIAVDPEDPDPYYGLGMVCQSEEEWDEAFEAFETAVRQSGDLKSLYQVGRTGVLSGQRLERAKQAFEQYIARGPDSQQLPSVAAAHWRLGMVYEHMGQKDQARREYETALELDGSFEQAREALKKL